MARLLKTLTSYLIYDKRTDEYFNVTLERIKNDVNGNARYEAHIVNERHNFYDGSAYCFVYRFTGGQQGERADAEFILSKHLGRSLA